MKRIVQPRPPKWNRYWVWMWGVIAVTLLALLPLVTFWPWTIATAVGFGLPEWWGLRKNDDAYPPLTHVIRHYSPRPITFILIGMLLGGVGVYWAVFTTPLRAAMYLGLAFWLIEHFEVTEI